MEKFCPITTKLVDENVARLNGVATSAIVILYLFTGFAPLLLFLAIDFGIRSFLDCRYSYLSYVNRQLASLFKLERKTINAGPKIFAAQVGLLLSIISLTGALLQVSGLAILPAAVLAFFSFLEGAFGICVACKLYPFVRSIFK